MTPTLLFLSPVTPAPSGNGRAMRAFRMLGALAETFDVSLLVAESLLQTPPDFSHLHGVCREIRFLAREDGATPSQRFRRAALHRAPSVFSLLFHQPPEWAPLSPARLALAAGAFPGVVFDAFHVFRLPLAPYADARLSTQPHPMRIELDLDDIESLTRRRIAALYRRNGRPIRALGAIYEAALLRRLEERWLPRFDRVWLCSRMDAERLTRMVPGIRAGVAPNGVAVPPRSSPPSVPGPFRFLFVGTLGYYPNQDGLLWFTREVLPLLRHQADQPFLVTVAGAGLPEKLARRVRAEPEMEIRGFVPDLSALYRESHAVLAPLRAGGGSRIKILEAFARNVPVLSTSMGAEGLDDVRPDIHLLLADEPADFARQSLRLMRDSTLRATLSANAHALVVSAGGPAARTWQALEP